MKSALKFYKISQHNSWHKANCPLFPTSASSGSSGNLKQITIPPLTFLSAARTLASLVPRKSYYQVLGLSPSATTYEIRQAFLKLSKQCHPDVVTGGYDPENHKKFVQVNEAYSVLSKPSSRRNYDASLNTSPAYTTTAYPQYDYHQPDPVSYAHYKGYQNNTQAQNKKGGKLLTNFFVVTSCLTCITVVLIRHYTHNYMPDPKFSTLKKINRQDIEQHELIMTAEHDGTVVYYYAVPRGDDSKSYEVLAVMKNQVSDSDSHELQELNKLDYKRQQSL